MHKAFYRIFAMTVTIILILCLCAPCFAAAPALTAAEELMALWSMYCESVGFSQSFTTNGSFNTVSNPFDSSVASSNMTTLYTEYATIANRVEDIQTTVNWIKANTEIAISNQQTGAFQYSAGVTEFFDRFTTWVLEDVVGVVKDSVTGLFNTSQPWFNNGLYYNASVGAALPTSTKPANGNAGIAAGAVPVTSDGYYALASIDNTEPAFVCIISGSVYCWSTELNSIYWLFTNQNSVISNIKIYNQYSSSLYYYSSPRLSGRTAVDGILTFNSVNEAGEYYTALTGSIERIQLRPKDRYNEDALGIPDVDATDYVGTRVQEGVTSVPYDEIDAASSAGVLDNLLAKVKALVLSNSGVLADVSYGTVEPVISPLAPFDLPSFNFNFSGIWHYVVSWIGSIRSGSSFIFSVWNNIPFAMTIPIYATAVVCIVVGVFRKVF